MKEMKKILLALLVLPFVANAHPGNRDINGCHEDKSTGVVHCGHAKGDGAQSSYYTTKDYSTRKNPTDNQRNHNLNINTSNKSVYTPNDESENTELDKQMKLKKRTLRYSTTKRKSTTSPYRTPRTTNTNTKTETRKPMRVRTMRTNTPTRNTVTTNASNDRLLLSVLNKYKNGSISDEKAVELLKKIFAK